MTRPYETSPPKPEVNLESRQPQFSTLPANTPSLVQPLKLLMKHRKPNSGRAESKDVGLAELVLREPRVESYHVADAAEGGGRHLEVLCRDEPGYAFAAGRGGEGSEVAVSGLR